jgi:hypothetical protein
VIVERLVRKVRSLLTRWVCDICAKAFTLYPSFAFPHKRYVRDQIFEWCSRYLEGESLSYRRAVQVDGLPVFYEAHAENPDDRTVAHSTLHRWIRTLGNLTRTLREALQMVRAKDACAPLFRQLSLIVVRSSRCRSTERESLLRSCHQLILAERTYRSLFDVSIFPHLATACRFS